MALEYVLLVRNRQDELCYIYRPSFEEIKEQAEYGIEQGDCKFITLIEIDGLSVENYEYKDMILE